MYWIKMTTLILKPYNKEPIPWAMKVIDNQNRKQQIQGKSLVDCNHTMAELKKKN